MVLQLQKEPALVRCVFANIVSEVERLIKLRHDVNYRDDRRRSVLHAAAFQGNSKIVELLVSNGANVRAQMKDLLMPLHIACSVGAKDVVEVLLRYQAKAMARDRHFQTPLHVAAGANNVGCMMALKGHIRDANLMDRLGRTPLHYAAVAGHVDAVKELLENWSCDVNAHDKKKCRPLHDAAYMGHLDIVKLLVDSGADIEAKDRNKYTPLHAAAAGGRTDVCSYLINAGAQVDARNASGNTPLHTACINGTLGACEILIFYCANIEATNARLETPLHLAAASPYGAECLNLLIQRKANVNARRDDQRTPLHITVVRGNGSRSMQLIAAAAEVEAADIRGCTALHLAAQYGHDLLVSTLLAHGADPRRRAYEARTVLHMCCLSAHVECCRKLLQVGVDRDAQDELGRTPLHCAAYNGSVHCLDLLLSNGADFRIADSRGRLPLHYAAEQVHVPCLLTLVSMGSPVNLGDADGLTALHLAAPYDPDGKCVGYLLNQKADLGQKDNRGYTPIHNAIVAQNLVPFHILIKVAGRDFPMHEMSLSSVTPLHMVAVQGSVHMLRGLMHYFPDINIRTDDGSTALILAARFGHYQLVSMLLKRDGVDVTAADKVKMTAIHYSACNGHYGCLQPLLAHVKGNQGVLDAQDAMHRTALILAAEYGHISCVKELIRVGANVNVVDSQSRSALHRAIYFNNRDLTYVLLSHGADVNVLDVNNKSLLHLAAKQGCPVDIVVMILRRMLPNIVQALDKQQCSALHWACYRDYRISKHFLQRKLFDTMVGNAFSPLHCAASVGDDSTVMQLLEAFGPETVHLRDHLERTPLHVAVIQCRWYCARLLLDRGANPDSQDSRGCTPLICAVQHSRKDPISMLSELLLSHKVDTLLCDKDGNTALHWTCLERDSMSALLLLEHVEGIDIVNAVNNEKKTALHIAARNGMVDVTQELIRRGASVTALDTNGLTPALCCTRNMDVAQCLAIILAHDPLQMRAVNCEKDDSAPFFLRTLTNVQGQTVGVQTKISVEKNLDLRLRHSVSSLHLPSNCASMRTPPTGWKPTRSSLSEQVDRIKTRPIVRRRLFSDPNRPLSYKPGRGDRSIFCKSPNKPPSEFTDDFSTSVKEFGNSEDGVVKIFGGFVGYADEILDSEKDIEAPQDETSTSTCVSNCMSNSHHTSFSPSPCAEDGVATTSHLKLEDCVINVAEDLGPLHDLSLQSFHTFDSHANLDIESESTVDTSKRKFPLSTCILS